MRDNHDRGQGEGCGEHDRRATDPEPDQAGGAVPAGPLGVVSVAVGVVGVVVVTSGGGDWVWGWDWAGAGGVGVGSGVGAWVVRRGWRGAVYVDGACGRRTGTDGRGTTLASASGAAEADAAGLGCAEADGLADAGAGSLGSALLGAGTGWGPGIATASGMKLAAATLPASTPAASSATVYRRRPGLRCSPAGICVSPHPRTDSPPQI
ncbi:hypothetical protein HC028_13110 [Planosporangium flavigriseum]|uniref:Uncharacterized protein n=1 Tax=Planosporangium flavigriseum TaxID=373681 RepID=A0A8J3PNZ8_9ACTN|nr:hypothetical protein [Planosporangium flavigriseum]NJC65438.1 hypothetical protein [Planosporangium flavigriseum]GIG75874.1 hypothetical protein Pfl04_42780 [Planosporangium flavigriseum]